ncbi:phosphatase-like protein [Arabidopsis thaliana]|uniref:Isoform 2 of Protein SGT1 homolog A n=1 Tax=Arabidopsis thaliana TaxID=3702 RepID=Q9SUR9-2|nr:phosphatase-like protein [Arabidopsis thaliana]AEE84778.1 phosphatase-like protein [Arabidopsis thaliana]|eukprot:NP_001031704.1 phosphatase-like protein [Arabidopsis thaliana]
MAKELADKAKEAFVDDDFDVAVDLYSKAIDLDPNCAEFFADRAQAYIKLESFTAEAVADANKAIELDPSLTKAYLRKGTACMKLEEYRTAKTALEKGASITPSESKFKKLIDECNFLITEEEKDLVQPVPSTLPSSVTAPPVSELDVTPTAKYRHEYYQKPEEVVVTVFAKGIPKQNVNIDFGEQILSVVIEVPGEDAYYLQPRLFGKIIPDKCKYEVLSTKIEICLAKADIITWASLEHGKGPAVLPKPNVSSEVSQRPAYPSSKKVKDWDKLEAEVKKQEKDEKLEGDAALNKFFREIYQNADEDMRRAMSKSFVESNGTVLSTNWQEVGTKTIESTPPDGMELKKWEI